MGFAGWLCAAFDCLMEDGGCVVHCERDILNAVPVLGEEARESLIGGLKGRGESEGDILALENMSDDIAGSCLEARISDLCHSEALSIPVGSLACISYPEANVIECKEGSDSGLSEERGEP